MESNAKLFRAIVVLGAALTAPACEGGKCGPNSNCAPRSDAPVVVDAGRMDAGGPVDADVLDMVAIL